MLNKPYYTNELDPDLIIHLSDLCPCCNSRVLWHPHDLDYDIRIDRPTFLSGPSHVLITVACLFACECGAQWAIHNLFCGLGGDLVTGLV